MIDLFEAFLKLETKEEFESFLMDLCSPGELFDFQDRWKIAQMLEDGDKSYRQIAEETGASVTTVGRVARFLKYEPYQGYKLVLNRIKDGK